MARETASLWGDVVTEADYPMDLDTFERLPDDGWRYELVQGRLIRMPPPGGEHARIARKLLMALALYVEQQNLGGEVQGEMGYVLPLPGEQERTEVAPDVSYVAAGRAPTPGSPEDKRAWRLAPDLAIEIASPDQYCPEMANKARLYLRAGTRLVWVVYPRWQQVEVWLPGASEQPSQVLRTADSLDGREVLPGFSFPIVRLF
jgi:Uma2 family endonuclease